MVKIISLNSVERTKLNLYEWPLYVSLIHFSGCILIRIFLCLLFFLLAIFLRISLTLICNFHLAKICLLANHDFCLRRFVRRCSIDYWAFKIIEPNGKPHRVTEPDNYYDCVLFCFFFLLLFYDCQPWGWTYWYWCVNSLSVYRIDDDQQNHHWMRSLWGRKNLAQYWEIIFSSLQ